MISIIFHIRLQQLEDNIVQDLALLNEYEVELRDEDDPSRQRKYRRRIEKLRESYNSYQQEYKQLKAEQTSDSSTEIQNVTMHLQQMDAKLNMMLSGQVAIYEDLHQMRQTLLLRYDTTEQAMIAVLAEHLNRGQLLTMQAVLDALEVGRVSEVEIQQVLTSTQQILSVLKDRGLALPPGHEAIAEVINVPTLDTKHRLKVSLPIIPFLLDYEAELELGTGINLKASLENLGARFRGNK